MPGLTTRETLCRTHFRPAHACVRHACPHSSGGTCGSVGMCKTRSGRTCGLGDYDNAKIDYRPPRCTGIVAAPYIRFFRYFAEKKKTYTRALFVVRLVTTNSKNRRRNTIAVRIAVRNGHAVKTDCRLRFSNARRLAVQNVRVCSKKFPLTAQFFGKTKKSSNLT